MSEILAKVYRGETVESIHRGHLIVFDGDGRELVRLGNPETVTFFRSSAKPFQAIPLVTSGAADRFGFMENEIALACASHSGEEIHTSIAAEMLQKIGMSEADLKCGAHVPFSERRAEEMFRAGEKPTQLHNNCSGKHAGMLAFAKHIGAETSTYDLLENPVQQVILRYISEFTEVPKNEIALGIDGCAAPNFALPVSGMARSFAKLVHPPKDFGDERRNACRSIVRSMMKHPELVGGSERLDTILMMAARWQFVSKIGADGVWLCGVMPSARWKKGLGIALKIEDGDDRRARAAISVEVLRRLGIFEAGTLRDYSPLPVKNRRGDTVGRVEAEFAF